MVFASVQQRIRSIKALKYFRVCDSDGSGEIDVEEFKVALFAVDPDSGNTVGFAPNAFLTPLDAFEVGCKQTRSPQGFVSVRLGETRPTKAFLAC